RLRHGTRGEWNVVRDGDLCTQDRSRTQEPQSTQRTRRREERSAYFFSRGFSLRALRSLRLLGRRRQRTVGEKLLSQRGEAPTAARAVSVQLRSVCRISPTRCQRRAETWIRAGATTTRPTRRRILLNSTSSRNGTSGKPPSCSKSPRRMKSP